MVMLLLKFIIGLLTHIERLLSSMYGCILIILAFFANLLQPDWFCFAVVFTVVIFDLLCGIGASLKQGCFVLSKLIRETFFKIGCYAFTLIGVVLIERLIHDSGMIGIKLFAALAAACELWSMSASLLIINPNFPFLRIFRLQLKGEIESKTGKNMDNILKDETK